jgi:hypothetical protein
MNTQWKHLLQNSLFGIILVIILPFGMAAQTFEWAKRAGGPGDDGATGLTTDGNGNLFMSGSTAGMANFDNKIAHSRGCYDGFVVQYGTNQIAQWVKTFGGIICDYAGDVTTDAAGNVYVTGYMSYDVYFDTLLVPFPDGREFYIAKYSHTGQFQWVHTYPLLGDSYNARMQYDHGRLYMVGTFQDTLQIGTASLVAGGQRDGFVSAWDTAGNFLWVRQGMSHLDFEPDGMIGDPHGNVYITAEISGLTYFGPFVFQGQGQRPHLIAKLNRWGQVIWAKQLHADRLGYYPRLALSPSGDLYAGGEAMGPIQFDSLTFSGGGMMWLMRLDTAGNLRWMQTVKGDELRPYQIAVDGFDNAYVIGDFQDSAKIGTTVMRTSRRYQYNTFLAHFADDGSIVSGLQIKNEAWGVNFPADLCLQGDTTLYITGRYHDTTYIGSTTLLGIGNYDIFLSKLNLSPVVAVPEASVPVPLSIYPNPAYENFSVSDDRIAAGTVLTLCAPDGKLVRKIALHGAQTVVSTEGLTAGLYFYRVEATRGVGILTGKLVVME